MQYTKRKLESQVSKFPACGSENVVAGAVWSFKLCTSPPRAGVWSETMAGGYWVQISENKLSEKLLRKWLESIEKGLADKADYLERIEKRWVSDDPDIQEQVRRWAQILDKHEGQASQILEDKNIPVIIKILAYLHTKKALRLVELSSKIQPGFGGDLLKCSSRDDEDIRAESRLFIARIKTLVRMQYYERLFGPERRKEVLKILQKSK